MMIDIFWRKWNRNPARVMSARNVVVTRIEVEAGLDLSGLVAAAWKQGVPSGERTLAGIFELQTDGGIWSGPEEKGQTGPLWRNGKARKGVSFTAWDTEEVAA
jgi:hypothetical protein